MIYDCIVIGGGISGLYISQQLSHKYASQSKKIALFEMGESYGGRIATFKDKKIMYEMGAARFNKNHKLLIGLLKKYNLKNKAFKIPSSWNNINTQNSLSQKYQDVNHLINELVKKCQSKSPTYLRSRTLFDICEDIYDTQTANFLKNNHPYDTEISLMNGEIAIEMFKNDLNEDLDFYLLANGLSQVTKKLYQDYKKNNGMFYPFHRLLSYLYKHNGIFTCVFDNKGTQYTIRTKNLILAIDGHSIQSIKSNVNIPHLNSIKLSPLLRTYSIYPKNKEGKYWFQDIGKVVTDNKLKFIIPYDMKNGVIMISYTDGSNAKYWQKKIINDSQQQTINKLLKKTFPNKSIPNPLETRNYYWDNGMSYWKKNADAKKISKNMISPKSNIPLYICGDSFSLRQAWIEGALETAHKVFKLVKL